MSKVNSPQFEGIPQLKLKDGIGQHALKRKMPQAQTLLNTITSSNLTCFYFLQVVFSACSLLYKRKTPNAGSWLA
jgi:hypothetical protein